MNQGDTSRAVEGATPAAISISPNRAPAAGVSGKSDDGGLLQITLSAIVPNRYQPRTWFDDDALDELTASIREHGVLQPVIVRELAAGGYELIAGERRLRAAQRAELATIPAVVRALTDAESSQIALIENVQREDLDPIDRSDALCTLASSFGFSQEQIAEKIGLERSTVANLMRLRDLSEVVRGLIRQGGLGVGHAKALLGADPLDREPLAVRAADEGWSVRALEREARASRGRAEQGVQREQPDAAAAPQPKSAIDRAQLDELERSLSEHLGTRVEIRPGRNATTGRMVLHFFDLDQFDGLLGKMNYKAP